jgi:hypothetical protein
MIAPVLNLGPLIPNAKVSDGWPSSNSQIAKRVAGQPFAPPSGSAFPACSYGGLTKPHPSLRHSQRIGSLLPERAISGSPQAYARYRRVDATSSPLRSSPQTMLSAHMPGTRRECRHRRARPPLGELLVNGSRETVKMSNACISACRESYPICQRKSHSRPLNWIPGGSSPASISRFRIA